jgi:LuxR family maltose regulon positive regulatory protein
LARPTLAAGLTRREIGQQLYISLNTVKTHTRELYRKLGASSQAEAVARAEALGLLEPSQSPG